MELYALQGRRPTGMATCLEQTLGLPFPSALAGIQKSGGSEIRWQEREKTNVSEDTFFLSFSFKQREFVATRIKSCDYLFLTNADTPPLDTIRDTAVFASTVHFLPKLYREHGLFDHCLLLCCMLSHARETGNVVCSLVSVVTALLYVSYFVALAPG